MSIYFVRHGQTAWNQLNKLQGNTDVPLNDVGRKQAYHTAKELKAISMDAIYCSPLIRAKETAEIINQNWNLPLQIEERLKERCFGEYEGQSCATLNYQELWKQSDIPPFMGAEDSCHFYQRVESFLDSIIPHIHDQNILLVAHGGVSIPYYCYFYGYAHDDLSSLLLANCEVSKMETIKCDLHQKG